MRAFLSGSVFTGASCTTSELFLNRFILYIFFLKTYTCIQCLLVRLIPHCPPSSSPWPPLTYLPSTSHPIKSSDAHMNLSMGVLHWGVGNLPIASVTPTKEKCISFLRRYLTVVFRLWGEVTSIYVCIYFLVVESIPLINVCYGSLVQLEDTFLLKLFSCSGLF